MRAILQLLLNHLRADFRPSVYAYTAVFLTVCITYNYQVEFEDAILDSYFGSFTGLIANVAFFAFAYYAIAIPQLWLNERADLLRSSKYWISSGAMIGLVGMVQGLYGYAELSDQLSSQPHDRIYLFRVFDMLKPFALLIPLMLFHLIRDGKLGIFYGFHRKRFNHTPYALMLLGMLPLIAMASFTSDFQDMYPRFKPWYANNAFGWEWPALGFVYELSYGLNLFFVEFMFRGMLVIGVAHVLGRHAILPMVSAYAFLHFGKPALETVGSIFGGYILGVISLNTRNILGGIWVHIGIAWAMEIAAYLQYVSR